MRALLLYAAILLALVSRAQPYWCLDSLLAQWPVRVAVEEARRHHQPGVVRAMDTRDLLGKLQKAAPGIPVFADDTVVCYVDQLGEPHREALRAALGLAKHYEPLIEGELVRQGLPRELKHLPLALSAMSTWGGTREGGAGLWALTYPVAVRYGLRVNAEIDERRDPRLSTMAAVRCLKDLHARHGDWAMAVAAFACGPANLTRASGRTGNARSVRTLYPHFTRNSVEVMPLWMAMTYLAAHAGALGITPIEVVPFEEADTIRSRNDLRITAIAAAQGIARERLRALNPTLCSDHVPAYHALLVPRGERKRFEAMADSVQRLQQWLAETERKANEPGEDVVAKGPDGREAIYYRVRSGDYLGRIAQRFHVGVSQLKAWNKLKNDNIDVGEELVIWVSPSQRARFEKAKDDSDEDDEPSERATPPAGTNAPDARTTEPAAPANRKGDGGYTWYTVRKGDSLYGIAKRYPGVDADSLMRVNGITADIRPGQRIKVPVKP